MLLEGSALVLGALVIMDNLDVVDAQSEATKVESTEPESIQDIMAQQIAKARADAQEAIANGPGIPKEEKDRVDAIVADAWAKVREARNNPAYLEALMAQQAQDEEKEQGDYYRGEESSAGGPGITMSLSGNIAALDRLKSEGAISEEEYQQQMQEIREVQKKFTGK